MTFKRITFSHKIVVLIAILALLAVPLVALASELVTAEVAGTANDVTVTQGDSTSFTINVTATGAIACTVTSGSPSTATVDAIYSISSAGIVSSGTPSDALDFFAPTPCTGTNGTITWTGAPTPYSVSASVSAAGTTAVGDYIITLSKAAGTTSETNPNTAGGKLDDATATTITVHVVAPVATNSAPTVTTTTADATGNEGDTLSTSGAFQDPDGDSLSLSVPSGTPGSFIDNGDGTWLWSFLTNDNISGSVMVTANDGHGHTATDTFNYSAANVAPTATFNSPDVDEGSAINLSLTSPSDPSSVDTAAGFQYAFDCGDGAGYSAFGASDSASCPTDDNGTRAVKGKIKDKDGGVTEYTDSVTIKNVAPTATFAATSPINEGGSSALSFTVASDPSSVDTATGFHYSFACDGQDSSLASDYASAGSLSTASCPFDDNSSYTVKGRIFDKDDGYTTYQATVVVNNVAPTASLGNGGAVNEGSASSVSFSNQFDPSNADTGAGFTYSYDFDNDGSFEATSISSASAAVPASFLDDGPGSRTVRARIADKDGGFNDYTTTITINNVTPTATLSNNGPKDEGSAVSISFSNQFDPSSADTSAGFHYAYDCNGGDLSGATYAGSGTSASTSCTFTDNGSYTVSGAIIDKDGGLNQYTTSVTVNNADPIVNSVSVSGGSATACIGGNQVSLSFNFSDAGVNDNPWAVDISWGDGSHTFDSVSSQGNQGPYMHTYAAGSYTPSVKVTDKDGGYSSKSASAAVSFLYNMTGILAPFNPDGTSVWKYGSTLPVKVKITDCNNAPVSGLAPKVGTSLVSSIDPNLAIDETQSTSAADTTGIMRYDPAAGQYIYNFGSKYLSDPSATYYMTVKGTDANGNIVTSPGIVQVKFGLKTK